MMRRGKIILEEEEEEVGGVGKNYLMEVQGEDIVCGILSKLPVKSLLICKSVCKEWRRLISSPYFINRLHLNKSKENPSFIACYNKDLSQVVKFDEETFDEKTLPLSYSRASPNFAYSIIAAPNNTCFFDGLICWLHMIYYCSRVNTSQRGQMIYICNPATRELLLLREVNYDPPSQPYKVEVAVAAFGPRDDDEYMHYHYYKVYAFFRNDLDRDNGRKGKYHLEVYSSMTKSWKAICRVRQAPPLGRQPVSVNGTIYWLPLSRRDCIFAIDWDTMDDENVVRGIRLPLLPPWHARSYLLQFEGCLSFILFGAASFDLWVLKEEDLWVKRCHATIPVEPYPVHSDLWDVATRKNEIFFSTVRIDSSSDTKSSYKSLSFGVDSKTWKEEVNWMDKIREHGYNYVSAFSETLLPCH